MSKSKPLPSQTYLLECFDYNPDTGLLAWKHRPLHHFKNTRGMNIWNARYPSKSARNPRPDGRFSTVVCNRKYLSSRIIWKLMTGNDPTHQIDHISINPSDDRWCNLREATQSQNNQNQNLRKSNSTGYRGVQFDKRFNKYYAKIQVNKQPIYLGCFDTAEQAAKVYRIAALKHHPNFNNVSR